MCPNFIKNISQNLLVPSATYAIFELGKNYDSIKNVLKNVGIGIKNNKSIFK